MRANTLFFLTITACVCLAVAQVAYDDCCLKYTKRKTRTQKYAVNYRLQVLDGSCNIPAIIFTMKKGRIVCADPKEPWVTELRKQIDRRQHKMHSKTFTRHNARG